MTEPIRLDTTEGVTTEAALAVPSGGGRAGAVIVVHEWWGLNDDIRGLCDRFADAGYLALAIDLYGGKSTTRAMEALQLANDMKTAEALHVVDGAVRYLSGHERCNGKVGVTGFCLGGGIAIAAACTVPGIACAAPFYGLPIPAFQTFSAATPPIEGHYAKEDPHITPERVRALQEKAEAAGARFAVHFYDGPHAFMRRADPEVFHPESAEVAWSRTLAFFGGALSSAGP